ncbi:uncharacterized protein LOC107854697 [Capsicum annuum]|uniref:uncharacterized protein LOC107854697 n=1 Tax=Capsicum annuum TaxID=4072 RepID=UPI0007BF0657|nr:uncharacterized protein LOC107854697 [Capsicum annuum]
MVNDNGGVETCESSKVTPSALVYNHPLFLSPSDVSEIQIISFQLYGVENFSIWFRSMRIALLGRNKLGIVDEHALTINSLLNWEITRKGELLGGIMYASVASVVWNELYERFNKIDGARTFYLHKEIATLSQGTASVSVYFSKLKDLWEEFEALVPAPRCECEKSKEHVLHL